MAAAAGAGITAWLAGAGASAATAAVAGAVASAVVTGAIYGAVIGAAASALSGGDILKGALKGALIGGISGGVLKGIGIATGLSPVAAAPSATAAAPEAGATIAETAGAEPLLESAASLPAQTAPQASGLIAGSTPPPVASTPEPLMDPSSKNAILAGTGQGLSTGVGLIGAQMLQSDDDKELAEFKAQQESNLRSQNVPGKFESKTAYMNIPDWWDEHLDPSVA